MKDKYYKPLYYDGVYTGKKRGRKTKEEKEKYLETQRFKIVKKNVILSFD
jgi:hypothetical protein|tara:strand:- start:753 stop:902 length:150 start_codon:yes stop_codon:yes gene_type:complete